MSNKELKSLHRKLTAKIEKLSSTEGFIDRDELEELQAEFRGPLVLPELLSREQYRDGQERAWLDAHAKSLAYLRRLDERLDRCTDSFHRYNVPNVFDFSSTKECKDAVTTFMRVHREDSKRGRARGWRSLTEWLSETSLPGGIRLRDSETAIGTRISVTVACYFALVAQSSADEEEFVRRISNFVAAIECLKVEGDHRFSTVVMFSLAAMNARTEILSRPVGELIQGVSLYGPPSMEKNLIHLILREVLRLEVAFSSPIIPMKVSDEVFQSMANHVVEVFDRKLKRIWKEMSILEDHLCVATDEMRIWEDLREAIGKVWKGSELQLYASKKALVDVAAETKKIMVEVCEMSRKVDMIWNSHINGKLSENERRDLKKVRRQFSFFLNDILKNDD